MNRPTENSEDHDSEPEPSGCLSAILRLFGMSLQPTKAAGHDDALPYRLSQRFLSPAELSFYKVLRQILPREFAIAVKPRLGDMLFVPRAAKGRWALQNKIQSKHVDFVICDELTMTPKLVVELDDKSHDRADRRDRDEFVDKAFTAAGLSVLHVKARAAYIPEEVRSDVLNLLKEPEGISTPRAQDSSVPICPKCGVPLVKRIAAQGSNKGNPFWGCPNFPDCRTMKQM